MPYVTPKDGCRIHYRVLGTGDRPVVMLQGLGLSSNFWFDLPQRLLDESKTPLKVILPDNRGTGLSNRSGNMFRMPTLADDVARVLDAAEIDSAYIVGISMGGMIAQQLAIHHGSRVRGLLLMATTPGLPFCRVPPPRSLLTLLSMPLAVRNEHSAAAIARLLIPKSEWHRASEIFEGWGELVKHSPLDPKAFLAQFAAASLHFTGGELESIRCPTEIVTGDSDVLIPPQNSLKLAERIRGAHLHVLKNVGHAIPSQDKAVIGRMVASLIDRVECDRVEGSAPSLKVA